MKRCIKKLICALIVIISLFMVGCFYYKHTDDIIYEGFKVSGPGSSHRGGTVGAVRSTINIFDIDDVTMDFYIGGEQLLETCQSVVWHFTKEGKILSLRRGISLTKDDEHKTLDGVYYMGEVDRTTFNNGPFDVSIRFGFKGTNSYFHFLRTLTIPKELFDEEKGKVDSAVSEIITGKESKTLCTVCYLEIFYKKLDNGKILIEKTDAF